MHESSRWFHEEYFSFQIIVYYHLLLSLRCNSLMMRGDIRSGKIMLSNCNMCDSFNVVRWSDNQIVVARIYYVLVVRGQETILQAHPESVHNIIYWVLQRYALSRRVDSPDCVNSLDYLISRPLCMELYGFCVGGNNLYIYHAYYEMQYSWRGVFGAECRGGMRQRLRLLRRRPHRLLSQPQNHRQRLRLHHRCSSVSPSASVAQSGRGGEHDLLDDSEVDDSEVKTRRCFLQRIELRHIQQQQRRRHKQSAASQNYGVRDRDQLDAYMEAALKDNCNLWCCVGEEWYGKFGFEVYGAVQHMYADVGKNNNRSKSDSLIYIRSLTPIINRHITTYSSYCTFCNNLFVNNLFVNVWPKSSATWTPKNRWMILADSSAWLNTGTWPLCDGKLWNKTLTHIFQPSQIHRDPNIHPTQVGQGSADSHGGTKAKGKCRSRVDFVWPWVVEMTTNSLDGTAERNNITEYAADSSASRCTVSQTVWSVRLGGPAMVEEHRDLTCKHHGELTLTPLFQST